MAKTDQNPEEIQDRTCRSCGRSYPYPVLKSSATRFYCERCVSLPAEVRAMFEHFNKRIRKLESQVEKRKGEPSPSSIP